MKANTEICTFKKEAIKSYQIQTCPQPPSVTPAEEIGYDQPDLARISAKLDKGFGAISDHTKFISAQNEHLHKQVIDLNQKLVEQGEQFKAQLAAVSEQIVTVQTTVEDLAAKKPVVHRKPRVLRSPLTLDKALEIFNLWTKAYDKASIPELRAICLVVLIR